MVLPFIPFDTNGGAMGLLSISNLSLHFFSGNERSFQFKTSKTWLLNGKNPWLFLFFWAETS